MNLEQRSAYVCSWVHFALGAVMAALALLQPDWEGGLMFMALALGNLMRFEWLRWELKRSLGG